MDFIPESFTLRVKIFVKRYAAACILCLLIIIFALSDTRLVSLRHIRNVFSDAAPLFLAAAGMGLCLFSGYIDLSAGSAAVFASVLAEELKKYRGYQFVVIPLSPERLLERGFNQVACFRFCPRCPSFWLYPLSVSYFLLSVC